MHATVKQASFQQTQPINVMSNGGFPSPVKSMIMSDPRKLLDLERQIRTACIRSATLIDVTETAPQTLLVRYVSRSESAAREAAQSISQMTALRPYTVQFDVRLANR
jgi:urease accessory protein UreH